MIYVLPRIPINFCHSAMIFTCDFVTREIHCTIASRVAKSVFTITHTYIILYSMSVTIHILVIYILKLPSTHKSYDSKGHVLIIKFETGCEREQYIISFGSLFLLNNGQFKIHWYKYIVLGNLYMAKDIHCHELNYDCSQFAFLNRTPVSFWLSAYMFTLIGVRIPQCYGR